MVSATVGSAGAMSAEEVQLVRKTLDAYIERDVPRVLESLDENVELFPIRAVLEGAPYRGHGGFRQFLADMKEDWQEFSPEASEVRDLGEGRVLVVGRFKGRLASGMDVETPAAWMCEVRAGKISKLRFYADEHAALDAIAAEQR